MKKTIIWKDVVGYEEKFYNIREFARKYEIQGQNICKCLKGEVKQHKGWKFRYEEIENNIKENLGCMKVDIIKK